MFISNHIVVRHVLRLILAGTLIVASVSSASAYRREELCLLDIPVVCTVSKMPQPVTEAPAGVDVISAVDIKNLGLRTLADALRLMNGMDVTDAITTNGFSMRGLNGRLSPNTTLVLLDGHPFNEVISGTVDPNCVPLAAVERIEVVRGPGSCLYGTNAMTGVINIITKSPGQVQGVLVNAAAGTRETATRRAGDRVETNREEITGGYAWDGNGILLSNWHYADASAGGGKISANDDRDDASWFGKFIHKDLTVVASRYRSLISDPGMSVIPSTQNHIDYSRDFLAADYSRQVSRNVTLSARAHAMKAYQTNTIEDIDPWTMTVVNILDNNYTGERVGIEAQATAAISGKNRLVIGVESRHDKSDAAALSGNKQIITNAAYLEDEFRPFDALILSAGARLDKADVYTEKLSPRASAVYKLTDATTLKASYGEAFRAPAFTELYEDDWAYNHNLHVVGNADLKPESIQTEEVGVMHAFARNLHVTLNVHRTRMQDGIVMGLNQLIPDTNPLNPYGFIEEDKYFNNSEFEVVGGEIGMKWRAPYVEAGVNYAYQDARDTKNDIPLNYAPKNKASLQLTIDIARGLQLSSLSYYMSDSLNHTMLWPTRDAIFITNARISWAVNDAFDVAVGAYNLTDKQYYEIPRLPLAGRTIYAEASYAFSFGPKW